MKNINLNKIKFAINNIYYIPVPFMNLYTSHLESIRFIKYFKFKIIIKKISFNGICHTKNKIQ